jgi:uncharacterized repeat protein (TIGR03806 family)
MVQLMASPRLSGLVLFTVATCAAAAALGACGSDEGEPVPDASEGGVAVVPPARSEFGLDTRPSNTTCTAPARPPANAPIKLERVFANVSLAAPMMIAQIPGDKTRWFVAQRGFADGGQATIVSFPASDPAGAPTPVATIGPLGSMGSEGGLLGMAFHPKFAQNGRLYVTWVKEGGSGQSEVGYFESKDNGATFPSAKYVKILGFAQPAGNHNGGGIAFGKDGLLYLSFGDGGGGDDQFLHGQNKETFFSKILRIDVDNVPAGQAYGIPDGNPFKNGGGEPATFAYGFRNPFRFSVDRETNEVWVGDVGQNTFEEIDAKVKIGGNYGWPCREGMHDSLAPLVNPPNASNPAKCPPGTLGLIDPVVDHVRSEARSITGGVVYRGKAIPGFVGSYIYGDYVTQALWTLSFDPGTGEAKTTQLAEPAANWVSFAEDNDGEVYAVALNQGAIYKVVAAEPAGPSTFPDRLSKTGCVDRVDPRKPAAGLVPYGVQAALWSDGAQKERWVALPDGTKITVHDDDGDFDFPKGTVLVKTFSLAGKRVETRLFMRHDDGGWNGYTYEWLDDQSDAVLLPAGKTKTVGAQTWTFPSRSECVSCHSEAAGRALGPELGQLNGDYVYASTNRIANQLTTLEHIGMFDRPLGKPVDQLVAYPDPYGTSGSLEQRARAYLHANCSNCHRPKGGGRGNMDLRFATAFADTASCNVDPEAGDIGVAGSKLFAPGDPAKSLVSVRPHSPAANRMPPLASSVVDERGVKLIDDWIRSVTACP